MDVSDPVWSLLDEGIRCAVRILRDAGIETYESCQGGDGHSYPEPAVRFCGDLSEGFRALAAVLGKYDLKVYALRRIWQIIDGEPTGPNWEIVFRPTGGQDGSCTDSHSALA